jgi:hypothetical protein
MELIGNTISNMLKQFQKIPELIKSLIFKIENWKYLDLLFYPKTYQIFSGYRISM